MGLRLDEAKDLLAHLQEVLLCNQIDEALAKSRMCDDCGKRLAIQDDRSRTLETLYGRFRVKGPRLSGMIRAIGKPPRRAVSIAS